MRHAGSRAAYLALRWVAEDVKCRTDLETSWISTNREYRGCGWIRRTSLNLASAAAISASSAVGPSLSIIGRSGCAEASLCMIDIPGWVSNAANLYAFRTGEICPGSRPNCIMNIWQGTYSHRRWHSGERLRYHTSFVLRPYGPRSLRVIQDGCEVKQ